MEPSSRSQRYKENFSFIATLVGFVIDLSAIAIAITTQVAPSIGFESIRLDPWVQLTLWFVAILIYASFLRNYRLQNSDDTSDGSEQSWWGYFKNALVIRFEKPLLLIPMVILFAFLVAILGQLGTMALLLLLAMPVFLLVVGGLVWLGKYEARKSQENKKSAAIAEAQEREYVNDNAAFYKWMTRVTRRLDDCGYVIHLDLATDYSISYSLADKILYRYFLDMESDKDLIYIADALPKPSRFGVYEYSAIAVNVLSKRSLRDERPWDAAWRKRYGRKAISIGSDLSSDWFSETLESMGVSVSEYSSLHQETCADRASPDVCLAANALDGLSHQTRVEGIEQLVGHLPDNLSGFDAAVLLGDLSSSSRLAGISLIVDKLRTPLESEDLEPIVHGLHYSMRVEALKILSEKTS